MFNRYKSKIHDRINRITLITLIIIFSAMLLLYFFEKERIIKNTNSELQNTNLAIVNMVETSASISLRNHLKSIADRNLFVINEIYKDYDNGKYSKEEAVNVFSKIILSDKIGNDGYTYVTNSKGILLIHPKTELINKDFSQEDFIKKQIENKDGYLEYTWKNPDDSLPRKKVLYMRYFEKWDMIISVSAYIDEFPELVNINDFKNEVLSAKYGETGYAYVITDKGAVVIHPNYKEGELWGRAKDSKGNEFIKKICDQKNGTISYFWKNPGEKEEKEKLVVFKYIPELKWIVVSGSYKDEYLKPLKNMQKGMLIISLLLLLLYIFQSYLITKLVVKPVLELVKDVRRVIRKEEVQVNKLNSNDELGELSESIILLNQAVKYYENDLENLVELRTSELNNTYEELGKSEELLRTLIETIPNPIFYKDINFLLVGCNSSFEKFAGKKRENIIGKSCYEIFPKDLANKCHQKDLELFKTNQLQTYEASIINEVGETTNIVLNKQIYYLNNKPMGIVAIIEDITERKKMEVALKELTVKDVLTGLYNRRGIIEISESLFQHSIRNNSFIATLMIDLDNFKLYNDTYGHLAGDLCLSHVANAIDISCSRPMDMTARYGGEEFLVILADTDKVGAMEVAERIAKNVRKLALEHSGNIKEQIVTVSIGVYVSIPEKIEDIEKFIKNADEKLYIAKTNGKGRVEM